MKKIIFTRPDGGLSVVHPAEGARLAVSVTLADGTRLVASAPQPVDRYLRRWPVAGAIPEWAETEEAFVTRIAGKDVPADAMGVRIVDENALPSDRGFRDAWSASDSGIVIDMSKAREIHKNHLRAMRQPLLEALDIDYIKAQERGDTVAMASITTKKQVLRDVPADPAIQAATTPEQLKAVLPVVLKG